MKPTYEELAVQLANVESKCRELAADKAWLKNALEWLYETVSSESVSIPDEKYSSVTNAAQALSETPATDAFLAEVRAQGVEEFLKFCGEENSVFVEAKAYYRSLSDAVDEFAAQLRKGAKS